MKSDEKFWAEVSVLNRWAWQLSFLLGAKGYPGLLIRKLTLQEIGEVPKEVWEIAAWYAAAVYRVCAMHEEREKNSCQLVSVERWRAECEYWEKIFRIACANC
jgi:hypothetical protein